MLTDAQVERYSRQVILPEVGGRGQARLLAARVALAGGGEAAAVAAMLLARAGIGALDLVDGPDDLPTAAPDCRIRRVTAAPAVDAFVDLHAALERALPSVQPPTPLVIGRQRGARAVLAVLVGRPCHACLPATALAPDDGPDVPALASATALALGALAASETLRALLVRPETGRRHVVDQAGGRFEAATLVPIAGCVMCGGTA